MMDQAALRNKLYSLKQKPKLLLGILGGVLLVIALCALFCDDSIETEEIKLVDHNGDVVLRVKAPLPNLSIQGKEYERARTVHGIQFLDAKGNEFGGLAVNPNEGVGGLCFNYETGEAGCFYKDKQDVALDIYSKKEGTEAATGTKRFALGFSGKDSTSFVSLADQKGKERIKLFVDNDHAYIKMYDANGHETYSISN